MPVNETYDEEQISLVMGAHPVFCGGLAIFHSEQYLCSHVQEYGHAERNAGLVYQSPVSTMDNQASILR